VVHLKHFYFSTFFNHLTVLQKIPKAQKEESTVFTLSTANGVLAESMRHGEV